MEQLAYPSRTGDTRSCRTALLLQKRVQPYSCLSDMKSLPEQWLRQAEKNREERRMMRIIRDHQQMAKGSVCRFGKILLQQLRPSSFFMFSLFRLREVWTYRSSVVRTEA